jgi:hypothetical protein
VKFNPIALVCPVVFWLGVACHEQKTTEQAAKAPRSHSPTDPSVTISEAPALNAGSPPLATEALLQRENLTHLTKRGALTITEWRGQWYALGKNNPDQAFAALSTVSTDDAADFIEARQSILDSLATTDPNNVWRSASKYMRAEEMEAIAFLLIKTNFQKNPTEAIKLFNSLLSTNKQIKPKSTATAFSFLLEKIAPPDQVSALETFASLNASFANSVVSKHIQNIRSASFEDACSLLLEMQGNKMNTEDFGRAALSGLVSGITDSKQFYNTSTWLSANYLSTAYAKEPIRDAVQDWTLIDTVSASEYISGLPRGDFRDYAVAGFVSSAKNLTPDEATQWAETINNPIARKYASETSARR